MIITEIECHNIGKHKKIHVKGIQTVMGFVGKNGSGKSTLASAVQGCLTGYWKDNQETYVRNWSIRNHLSENEIRNLDPNEYPNNGSVRLTIQNNEDNIEIFRQVGKSPRVWIRKNGGEQIKKVKDINKILYELFGADPASIRSSVFIEQGKMMDMFFSKESDRIEHFMRVLNLDYMRKHGDAVMGKLSHIRANTVDLTEEIQRKEVSIVDCGDRLREAEKDLSEMKDWTSDISTLTMENNVRNGLSTEKKAMDTANSELITVKETLLHSLRQGGYNSSTEYKDAGAKVRENLDALINLHTELQASVYDKKRILVSLDRLAEAQRVYDNAKAKCDGWKQDEEYAKEIKEKEQFIHDLRAYQSATQTLEEKAKALQKLVDNPVSLPTDKERKDSAAKQKESLTQMSDLQQLINWHKVQTEILDKKDRTKGSNCGICGLQLASVDGITQESVDKLMERIQVKQKEVDKLTNEAEELMVGIREKDDAHREWEMHKNTAQSQVEAAQRLYDKSIIHDSFINETFDIKVLVMEVDQIIRNRLEAAQLRTRRDAALDELNMAHAGVDEQDPEPIKKQLKSLQVKLYNVSKDKADTQVVRDDMFKYWKEFVDPYEKKIEELQNTSRQCQQRIAKLEEALSEIKYSEQLQDYVVQRKLEQQSTDYTSMISDLKTSVELRNRQIGSVSEMKNTYERERREYTGLLEKQERAETMKQIETDLKIARDLILKQGLPTMFISAKFAQILEIARVNLEILNSNFTIRLDSSEVCAFEFLAYDENDAVWQRQNKMSGGQRVRLATAFLMAIQQVLVPDVGLLFLDEPSNHLDVDGKQNLRDLLLTVPRVFSGSNFQLCVIDHVPEVRTGIQTRIDVDAVIVRQVSQRE